MDGPAEPTLALDRDGTPQLALDGYAGPLEGLLELARTHQVDLRRIPLAELLDQLIEALRGPQPLGQKGDWLVMAARLLVLRSRLLLPVEAEEHAAATRDGEELRGQLLAREGAVALARWLGRRPQLGWDCFARGCPEERGGSPDVVAFLWASLMVFEHQPATSSSAALKPVYRVVSLDLPSVAEARERIIRLLAGGELVPLTQLLGASAPSDADPRRGELQRRGALVSTFSAGLELVKQGLLRVEQDGPFEELALRRVDDSAAAPT